MALNGSMPWCKVASGVLLLLAAVARVEARTPEQRLTPLTDRFSLSLGTFIVATDTDVQVDGTAQSGDEVSLERELGFDDTDNVRVDSYWRFARRHKLRVLYFDTQRTESRQLAREITVGDVTYPVDVELTARLKTEVAEIAYAYAFLRRDSYEVAATLGVHNLRFDLGLSATSSGGINASRSNRASVNGPLPVVGASFVWLLPHDWHIEAQAQFFRLEFDPYTGRLDDYSISAAWMPVENFGLGLGYNTSVTRVDVGESGFNGRLKWDYGGWRAFLRVAF